MQSSPPGTRPHLPPGRPQAQEIPKGSELEQFAAGQQYLRGLFSGGTLAYEALLLLQDYVPAVYSNVPLEKEYRLANSLTSQAHTIVDLGEDEFTVGRLHPMMDNDLRIRRLAQEAAASAGRKVPVKKTVVGLQGNIVAEEWL